MRGLSWVVLSLTAVAAFAKIPEEREIPVQAGSRVALPGNAFTIALVVTPGPLVEPPQFHHGYVCGLGTGYWDGFRLRFESTETGVQPSLEIGKPKGQGSFPLEAEGTIIPAGATRHLAATWDGHLAKVFVDGVCVVERRYEGAYVQEGKLPFTIGHAAYGLGYRPFTYKAVRLWSAALAAEDIASLAQGTRVLADTDIARFLQRPRMQVIEDLANGTLEEPFRPMALQMASRMILTSSSLDLPVSLLDRFSGVVGTNDVRRMRDLKVLRLRSLLKEKRTDEALAAAKTLWEEASQNGAGHAPWAGLAYATLLERRGRADEARVIRQKSADLARPYLRDELNSPSSARGGHRALPVEGSARGGYHARPVAPEAVQTFYVAAGAEGGDGTKAHPFGTLEAARDAIRQARTHGVKGLLRVFVRGGFYSVTQTLELGHGDSDVSWEAAPQERPVFDGGWRVPALEPLAADDPAGQRIPVAARPQVRVCDLKAAGYPHFERRPEYGFYRGEVGGQHPMTDLYLEGRPLELARHPNEGWFQTGPVLDGTTNHVFTVAPEVGDLSCWKAEPELMLTGYWCWHWADLTSHVPSEAFDVARRTISLGSGKGIPQVKEHRPFFFVNALCALDRPGEWYLDRATGRLYVWPPKAGELVLSSFDRPFISVQGATNVAVKGFVFQYGRGTAFVSSKCRQLTFKKNVVRNFGNDAAWFLDSKDVLIQGNRLQTFGHGALRVSGGDRKTLTPSGISIVDNEIAEVERWKRTYAPGVHASGCGTEIARNHFHDMRSSAMRLEGNDYWVASNIVERVVTESDDQGGIDIFANPSYAGDVICFNVWRDIGCGGENAPCGQAGVRFDDAVSSMVVYGNYFENCSRGHFGAVQMNGGRNNVVDGNVFVNCAKGVSIGRWPEERWKQYFQRQGVIWWTTQEVDIHAPPYSTKYPGIDQLPSMGLINVLTRNVVVGKGVLSDYPPLTVTYANRAFETKPSGEDLAREPTHLVLPPESALGPRPVD